MMTAAEAFETGVSEVEVLILKKIRVWISSYSKVSTIFQHIMVLFTLSIRIKLSDNEILLW